MPSLFSGLVSGINIVISSAAYSALIFSGDLSAGVSGGLALFLFSAAVANVVVALMSSYSAAITTPQDAPVAVLSVVAASVYAAMKDQVPLNDILLTITMVISLSSLLTGILFTTLGAFRLGKLVRFIPYPVIGGFMAGSGILFFRGALGSMFGFSGEVFDTINLLHWVPGILFGVILLAGVRMLKHFLVIPVTMVMAIVAVHLSLHFLDISIEVARAEKLLPTPLAAASWKPLFLNNLFSLDYALVFSETSSIFTVSLIGVVAILLIATGLELEVKRDIDIDRELVSAGFANALASIGGSSPCYISMTQNTIGYKMGANSRVAGLSCAVICVIALIVGPQNLLIFPKPILGGLLLYIGLDFLLTWLVLSWRKLPRLDYAVIVIIVIVIAGFGYTEGVITGIILSTIIFVYNFSKISAIKIQLSGLDIQSNVERADKLQKKLKKNGLSIQVIRLEGFLFFGSANELYEVAKGHAEEPETPDLHYLVFDFRHVSGIDSSALSSFVKIKNLAENLDFHIVISGCSDRIEALLAANDDFNPETQERIISTRDLDHALEKSEEGLLVKLKVADVREIEPLTHLLAPYLPADVDAERIDKYFETKEYQPGEYLVTQGRKGDTLYYIESGTISVELEIKGKDNLRLKQAGAGTLIGEMGLYLNEKRTASIIAQSKCLARCLTEKALLDMQHDDPPAAAEFNRFIIRLLSERVKDTNRLLQRTVG